MAKLIERFTNSPLPIALKWSMMIAIFISIAMSILGWFLIEKQSTFHHQQNQVLGTTLVNQLARVASEPLLAEDELALSLLVHPPENDELIIGMQIYDKGGSLKASSGIFAISDIRFLIETKTNIEKLNNELNWQRDGTKAVSYYSLIKYQNTVVGIALVTFDKKPLESQLSQLTTALILTTLGLVMLSIFFAFPLALKIYQPIRKLVEVGDALNKDSDPKTAQSTTGRRDEIGRVLNSFAFLAEGMEKKKKVETALSQFLSPSIAKQVLDQPKGTQLGGSTTYGSVLFCDVVGFTPLSEQLKPAEVGDLLNQYFKYFSIAAHGCQGTVDKFIGDCVMILFGVPETDEQHAIHAVTAAVLIQKIAIQINLTRLKEGLPRVQFRIGVNSGEMLAGNLGSDHRMQYTVVGDAVNLGSRLCEICDPGQVLVSKETLEQTRLGSLTDHQSLGEVNIRGRKSPIYPYKIDVEHFLRKSDIDNYLERIFGEGSSVDEQRQGNLFHEPTLRD